MDSQGAKKYHAYESHGQPTNQSPTRISNIYLYFTHALQDCDVIAFLSLTRASEICAKVILVIIFFSSWVRQKNNPNFLHSYFLVASTAPFEMTIL